MSCSAQTLDLIHVAADAAVDKMATDPVAIDVSGRLSLAGAFLICSAPSERQVRAIAEHVMDQVLAVRGEQPDRIEGRSDARWILLDYADVVVHVLVDEDREYYALEKLWGDQPVLSLSLGAYRDATMRGVAV